VQKNRVNLT